MRNIIRYLFLMILVAVSAVFWSGTATATLIGNTTPTSPIESIGPADGQVVGVAHPVTVRFAAPVADRAKAERSIDIRTTQPLTGTFAWTSDREAVWTPTGFLPANARITVGVGNFRTEFETNAGVYGDGDMSAHTFTLTVGGIPRTMPASYGKPKYPTPSGTFPVLEKARSVVFDSRTIGIPLSSPEGYVINGEFAERLTWGGVYIHSAPWSVEDQGNANVSHGCLNLSPENAEWVYNVINVGDPVTLHW